METIALTGGIASGKSMVARRLQKLGAAVVDADLTTHRLQEVHAPLWEAYVAHFGEKILLPESGELNRPMIADIIYGNDEERRAVNAMAHTTIKKAMYDEAAALKEQDCRVIFFDVPLLFEAGWDKDFARIWLVYVPFERQIKRLMLRDNMTEERARRIIDAQMPAEEKIAKASVVIDNSGNRRRTYRQVDREFALLNVGDE